MPSSFALTAPRKAEALAWLPASTVTYVLPPSALQV